MFITEESPKVCTIGLWHLGCVTSACLSQLGYTVVGYDASQTLVDNLNQGMPPLYEQDLAELIDKNLRSGRLSFTTDLGQALKDAKHVLLTYDTPLDENDEVDLSPLRDTASRMAPHLEKNDVTVTVCSQVPVGTCEELAATIRRANPTLDFSIAYVPENLRLGQAVERFMRPDMIIIGADVPSAHDKVTELLADIRAPKLRMSLRTAEMTKHAINSFLATCISFINEIANICDDVGADALKVAAALRMEERIGPRLPLQPGLGFAGGTLARDLRALTKAANKTGNRLYLLESVLEVNRRRNAVVTEKLHRIYGSLDGLTVGILGLTYKAGTSTLRRSAAVEIIASLVAEGAHVKAYDPKADPKEAKSARNFQLSSDPYLMARGTDALVFLTDWPEFMELDWPSIRQMMKRPVLIDARNMLDAAEMGNWGFAYHGIGRGQK